MFLWDPFEPFFANRTFGFRPAADVTVSDSDLVMTFDLPGMTSDDIEIEVVDNMLTLRGERARPSVPEGSSLVHNERSFGRFERTMRLPAGIDPDAVTATFDHGVLSLIVPKPERLRPRTIEIGKGTERKELVAA